MSFRTHPGIIVLSLAMVLFPVRGEESALVVRGGIDGKPFSEVGRLYVDDDKLIHFRSDQRLYYFSHMYYIWDTLAKAGVVTDGKILYNKPVRITGNYSKAAYVYNFLEEPAMRGSQIMWIDRIEKLESQTQDEEPTFKPLFDGKSLKGWSASPDWKVTEGAIACSSPSANLMVTQSNHTDFELSFEYRASWGVSASLLLRADERGQGMALSLDHMDEGIIGFPKSAAGASRPFMLFETHERRGAGANAHDHIQYDGRSNYDEDLKRDHLLERCRLADFLREWDGGFWNLVRVRCVGTEPEITVWINGFLICRFKANSVALSAKNPPHIGAMETFTIHPSGRVGFAIHATESEDAKFSFRQVRLASQGAP